MNFEITTRGVSIEEMQYYKPVGKYIYEIIVSLADGRPRYGSCSSSDALVTMFSTHNIHCSIVHPRKRANSASLWGGK